MAQPALVGTPPRASDAVLDVPLAPAGRAPGEWLLSVLARSLALFPWRARAAFGAFAAWFAGTLLRVRRAHVEACLVRAGLDPRAARGMYGSLGAGLIELLWLANRRADISPWVTFDEAARRSLDDVRQRRRGVVIAASHTGNWDLAACAVAREMPLVVVTKRLRVRFLDAFWQRTRAARGVRLVEPRGALRSAHSQLQKGGAVAMMLDQVPARRRHGVRGSFLGATAWLDKTPATVAARSGAPLLVAAGRRLPNGTHVISTLATFEPPARADAAWIEATTREATAALERFICAHPTSWLWLHRRWKEPPLE